MSAFVIAVKQYPSGEWTTITAIELRVQAQPIVVAEDNKDLVITGQPNGR